METLVNNSYIASLVRNTKDGGNIQRTRVSDLATFISANSFELRYTKLGQCFLHLENTQKGDFIHIFMGPSVDEKSFPKEGKIAHIVNNYSVFTGTTDRNGNKLERPWVRFAAEGTPGTPVEVMSTADIAKLFTSLQKGA
jgi:hypothetical protein